MADELIAGRYTIQDELGRGASATVYRAHDTLLDRSVALKVIASSLASDPEFTWRFEQEARLAARLDHSNIVTVHDVGTLPDGRAFIAMRLLQGKSLDKLITERQQLPPAEVINIVDQLAAALDYTHAAGLVHRDVKPSNVTIDGAGRVTLTDFGIARALDSARVTLPGLTIGTPRYMSPEQVRGEDTTPATDEYSLAVMAYEMMAGRPPFDGDGTALMYKIVHEPAPPPNSFNPWLPVSVAEVIQKALAKNPEERWPSSGEFARRLKEALATSTGRSAALAAEHSGQTTVVSMPPTEIFRTGESPATQVSPGTGPQPVPAPPPSVEAEPEKTRTATVIPPAAATTVAAAATGAATVAAEAHEQSATVSAPVAEPVPASSVVATGGQAAVSGPPDLAPAALKDTSSGQSGRGRRGLIWGIAAAVVVGGAALAAFLLLGGGDGKGKLDSDTGDPTSSAGASVQARVDNGSVTVGATVSATGEGSPTATSPPSQDATSGAAPANSPTRQQGSGPAPTNAPANTPVPNTATSAPGATNTPTPVPTNTPVPPTATNTVPAGFYAKITDIKIEGSRYAVYFDTNSWNTAGGDHVVFYFNTSSSGIAYYVNGVFKFTGFSIQDKPSGATQMCVISADGNGNPRSNTGGCSTLPPIP